MFFVKSPVAFSIKCFRQPDKETKVMKNKVKKRAFTSSIGKLYCIMHCFDIIHILMLQSDPDRLLFWHKDGFYKEL